MHRPTGASTSSAARSDARWRWCRRHGAELDALGREAQAVEPVQRVADLVGIEAVRAELAAQLLGFGARVAAPVVFVDEHEHFEHGLNIAQPTRCAVQSCANTTHASGRASAERDALEQAAGQARDAGRPVRVRAAAPAARRRCSRCARTARRGSPDRSPVRRSKPGSLGVVGVRLGGCRGAIAATRRRAKRSSSSTSCTDSTSLAPWRISAWQPRDCGEWIEPGIANTSLPCSAASRAVISEPDCSAASTTSVPLRQARDDAVALREVLVQRRRAERVLAHDQALRRRCGAPGRGAAPGRRGPARCPPPPRWPAASGRRRPPARLRAPRRRCPAPGPTPPVMPASPNARAKARAFSAPCGVGLRLPTMAMLRPSCVRSKPARRAGRASAAGRPSRAATPDSPHRQASGCGARRRGRRVPCSHSPASASSDAGAARPALAEQRVGLRRRSRPATAPAGVCAKTSAGSPKAASSLRAGDVADARRQRKAQPACEFFTLHAKRDARHQGLTSRSPAFGASLISSTSAYDSLFERAEHHQQADALVRQLQTCLPCVAVRARSTMVSPFFRMASTWPVSMPSRGALVDDHHLVLRRELHRIAVDRDDACR